MRTIKQGDHGNDVRVLQRAINRRLASRGASKHRCKEDGVFGKRSLASAVKACYLLGMSRSDLADVRRGRIDQSTHNLLFHPGRRSGGEKQSGKRRVARHRLAVKRAEEAKRHVNEKRRRIVNEAERAAANYRRNPGAYHYLAGGVANTIYLEPSPSHYRSDCSQFAAAVYKGAGCPSPAQPLDHRWASTYSIVKAKGVRFVNRANRKPGMLGMYGSREAPHHVEIWCGTHFIGHGSPPIDSLTPGEPDYYVDFDFLN